MHIFMFLTKLRDEGKLSEAENEDVSQLLSHLTSMKNLWAARDLEVMDENGHPLVDDEIKYYFFVCYSHFFTSFCNLQTVFARHAR